MTEIQDAPAEGQIEPLAIGPSPWWMFPNLLSLDAPLVAVVWAWFFAHSYGVGLVTNAIYFVLAITVWLIYTADRLIDVSRHTELSTATDRHRFHRKYRGPITVLFVILLGMDTYLVLFAIPAGMFWVGVIVLLLVMIYLMHMAFRKGLLLTIIPKEFFCGLVFAAGVALPSVCQPVLTAADKFYLFSPPVFGFALLCSLNCVLISCWEWREDRGNDPAAITNTRSAPSSVLAPLFFFVIGLATSFGFISLLIDGQSEEGWLRWLEPLQLHASLAPLFFAIAASGLLLLVLHLTRRALSTRLLRLLVDAALLTPLVIAPLSGLFSES